MAHCGTHCHMQVAIRERKSDRLVARVSRKDKELFERAAALEGRSMGAFVVSHVRAAAAKVVQGRETIHLNQQESRRFIKALLAPARPPTKRFKEALRLHRETVTER